MRKGSQRVKNKNIRPFANVENGLFEIKIKQLLECELIDEIIISTNDETIKDLAQPFLKEGRVSLDHRPDEYCSSEATTDKVVGYVSENIASGDDIILWTHVTSPLFDGECYKKVINAYFDQVKAGFDSLMTVEAMHEFLCDENGPINFNKGDVKWPQTQKLDKMFKVNSAAFITSSKVYKDQKNRIGNNVFMYESDKIESLDIDWEEDFVIAESLWKLRGKSV